LAPLLPYYDRFDQQKYIAAKIEMIRSKRMLAVQKSQMNMVWPELLTEEDKIVFSDDEKDEFFDDNYFRR
jgi:hypothetical protein